jgi:alkylation response protein AidB-like acyl-CoA dehydrogenase
VSALASTSYTELLARVQKIGPLLDSEANVSEAEAGLTEATVRALLDEGLIDMAAPSELGGAELPLGSWLHLIEEVSRWDGPSGWVTMATSAHAAMFGTLMSEEASAEIFANGPPVIPGMPAPRGKAQLAEGGYHFSGRHQFASGSVMATHFTAGAIVYDGDEIVRNDDGTPRTITVIVPEDQVRRLGNWTVSGMEATASIDYEINPMFIPEKFALSTNPWPTRQTRGSVVALVGGIAIGPIVHSAVALGMGRRALQEIAALAPSRTRPEAPLFPALAEQPVFQSELTLLDVQLNAARLYYYTQMERIEGLLANGGPLPLDEARRTQQTVRYIHDVVLKCVDLAHARGGSAALRKGHVIGRLFRNMHATDLHIVVDRNILIDAAPFVLKSLQAELESGAHRPRS